MDDTIPVGSDEFWILLGMLVFSRGMDFLSTWVATPNLVLEGNPIAKRLGWKWGGLFNIVLCLAFAITPVPAIAVCTTSLLVAAHNFNNAWLMRTMGESAYANWHIDHMLDSSFAFYFLCLLGQTSLTAMVGAALLYYGDDYPAVFAIGLGIVAYSGAVLFFTTLSSWRIRRHARWTFPPKFTDDGSPL